MELLLLAFFAVMILFFGLRKLWESATKSKRITKPNNQMLFMAESRTALEDLMYDLTCKVTARSREVAKADGRFVVTPADMKQAYEEIIREEHM